MLEILLFSVVLSTGYVGPMILRRFGPGQRLYGLMLMGDFVLGLLALIAFFRGETGQTTEMVAVLAIGAGVCLLIVPGVLRDFGRRAMKAGRLRTAILLTEAREILQPGMGARPECELLRTVLAVREGREQDIVDSLDARRRNESEPLVRRALGERIVMTYLYAQRWDDAAREYERLPKANTTLESPQLSVEMVRAYCEKGDIEEAAVLLVDLEESPIAKEPLLVGMLARARMVFLAYAGRTTAVESIVGQDGPLSRMPEAARSYWSGVARLNAGDSIGARQSLERAVELSSDDPRARELAQGHLERMDERGWTGPPDLPTEVAALADKLTSVVSGWASSGAFSEQSEARESLPRLSHIPLARMPVTVGFAVINLAMAALVYWKYQSITDLGALVEMGANLKAATLSGEWWRLGSSTLLHVGLAHLALNVYGLWVLGRLLEQMQGSARTFVVYVVAALCGSVASTFLGGGATGVGASGAVLGIMAACAVELWLSRGRYPKHFSAPLLRLLIVLSVAQIAIGFFYPIVDQWGHIGGFVGGAVVALIVSPGHPVLRLVRRWLSHLLVGVCVALSLYVAWGMSQADYGETLEGYPQRHHELGGLVVSAPGSWEAISERELLDPGISAIFDLRQVQDEKGLDAAIAARIEAERYGGATQAGFDQARPSARSHMTLPEPWRGGELEVRVDSSSGEQFYRLVVFGRKGSEDMLWLGAYYHPARLTDAIEPSFAKVLQSIRTKK